MSSRAAPKKPNPRKPLQRVSTDLSHYDRSDPFAAMNALRKLLSFLPNNPGAHRYKMTPDEHRLTMHLLTIVEPFVGPTISHHNITRMPNEILDEIASYVDLKRDLLSLALTCHRMRDVFLPNHFRYRVVKAKVSSMRVWHHLAACRASAQKVRRLEIMDERSSESEIIIPPNIATTDADVESTYDGLDLPAEQEKLLVSAVAEMHGLQSFKWSRTHSLISIESLWPTLLNCPQLSLVDLNDNTMFLPLEDQDPEEGGGNNYAEEDTILMGMTAVSIKSIKSFGVVKHPQLIRVSGLLTSCPNLKNLDVTYFIPRRPGFAYPIADDFYLCGRWKNLTSLTLNNLRCTTEGLPNLAVFLSEHENLEILRFRSTGAGTEALALPYNTLPRLKELESDREFANAILSCNTDISRPLETLKGIDLSGSESDPAFFENLTRIGDKISRVELASWGEMKDLHKLLECVPRLTWLNIGNHGSSGRSEHGYGGVRTDRWAQMLELVPNIETFYGVKFFQQIPDKPVDTMSQSDRSKSNENAKTASTLAQKCRKLKRLEHWEDGGSKIVVLLREDSGPKYKTVHIKPENRNDL